MSQALVQARVCQQWDTALQEGCIEAWAWGSPHRGGGDAETQWNPIRRETETMRARYPLCVCMWKGCKKNLERLKFQIFTYIEFF